MGRWPGYWVTRQVQPASIPKMDTVEAIALQFQFQFCLVRHECSWQDMDDGHSTGHYCNWHATTYTHTSGPIDTHRSWHPFWDFILVLGRWTVLDEVFDVKLQHSLSLGQPAKVVQSNLILGSTGLGFNRTFFKRTTSQRWLGFFFIFSFFLGFSTYFIVERKIKNEVYIYFYWFIFHTSYYIF